MFKKFAFLVATFLLFAGTQAFGQDVLYMEDGGKVKGKILKAKGSYIVIKTKYSGVQRYHKDEIRKVVRGFNPEDDYRKKLAEIDPTTPKSADKYYELGLYCEKHRELKKYVEDCYRRAIDLDYNHPRARAKLSYRRYKGDWITQEEYKKMLGGFVKVGDDWVRAADVERAKAELKRKEEERLRKWEEWKKKQEREREEMKRNSGKKSGGYSPPKMGGNVGKAKLPKASGYVSFKKMFKDTSPATSWDNAYVVESRFYRIRSNTKKKYLRVYGIVLDKFFEKFLRVFRYNKPIKHKSEVWIYGNQQQFMQYTRKPRGVGGFYNTGNRRVTAYHGTFGMSGNTITVLAHEATHQFQHLVLGTGSFIRSPMWIVEGLAVFFESAYYDGKKVIIGTIPRDRLMTVQRMVQRGNYIRINTLIRTRQQGFTATHYAHAWSIIYWMVYTNARNRRVFMQIWEKCKRGGMSVPEFLDIIKVDVDKWEKVWIDWVKTLKP